MNVEKLREILNQPGARIVTIEAETPLRMRKTNNPYVGAVKLSTVNCVVNCNYSNSVNNQCAREDIDTEFESAPRQWGQRIQGTPFVEHKGEFYLETKVERSLGETKIVHNGKELSWEDVQEFLPKKNEGARQPNEKKVIWRDYKVSSIKSVTVNGTTYTE